MVAVLTLVQEVEKDCFGQTLIAWVAMQLTHAKPIKLPHSVGRGFGWTHYIHPQINQIETPIPINVGTTAAKIKIIPAFLLMGASSSSVNS